MGYRSFLMLETASQTPEIPARLKERMRALWEGTLVGKSPAKIPMEGKQSSFRNGGQTYDPFNRQRHHGPKGASNLDRQPA